jgi:hypothetical protein
LLVALASVPFLPGAVQVARRGVPDVLSTGDPATLELRTLHAARGKQLLGPYSRFRWSHPGPAFFYGALPFYELSGQRGQALSLFAFACNLAVMIASVLVARRLGGTALALAVATVLGVYGMVVAPFGLSGDWNPLTPIFPLGLLSLLAARLALGDFALLPWFALVASAVVQTHVGFVPVTIALCLVPAVFAAASLFRRKRAAAPAAEPAARSDGARRARALRLLGATLGVLAVIWWPPLYEQVTAPRGNLSLLIEFFTDGKWIPHDWGLSWGLVLGELARGPLAIAGALHFPPTSRDAPKVVGVVEVAALVFLAIWSVQRRRRTTGVLAAIALAEIAAALIAVRRIRGTLEPYLLYWVSILGAVGAIAVASPLLAALVRRLGEQRACRAVAAVAVVALGLGLVHSTPRTAMFAFPDTEVEALVQQIEHAVVSDPINRPTVHSASSDAWPAMAGLFVQLYKHRVPVFVEPYFVFLVGPQFAPRRSDGPQIYIGDRKAEGATRKRRDQRVIAAAGKLYAYVEDPTYLERHRFAGKVALVGAHEVIGDPAVTVDGAVPPTGTRWDSPASVVLPSTRSWLEVAVPTGVNGMFLSIDGNDIYAVRCLEGGGGTRELGTVVSGAAIGMGTGLVFADGLESCLTVRVSPVSGDKYYSVAEIGFLVP